MDVKRVVPLLVTYFIVAVEVAISFNSSLLPNLKADFYISDQLAQMSIAVGLFALGFSGIVYGGLSDTFGRRPMFLLSLGLFSVTALLCAVAPNATVFLIARFLQGMGSGAGWVVGNACLKDIFHGKHYVRIINVIHAVAGITPAIAPMLGSYLAVMLGWRACFLILAVFSSIAAICMFRWCPETLPKKSSVTMRSLAADYVRVLGNRQFIRYCGVKVIAVMLIFCEVSTVPLVFVEHLQVVPQYYGLYVFPVSLCYILANCSSHYLNRYLSLDGILSLGLGLMLVSNAVIVVWEHYAALSAESIQCIKALTYMGWGLIFGNATSLIVSAVPEKSGMASSLMIALEMLFSALGIYVLGLFFNGTILPLSIFIIGCVVISGGILWLIPLPPENVPPSDAV